MHSAPINLQIARKLFANPLRIEGSNFLRREISSRMREKLELVNIQVNDILDAGCGQGEDFVALKTQFPQANLFGIDLSEKSLIEEKKRSAEASNVFAQLLKKVMLRNHQSNNENLTICGNFENLCVKNNSFDVIWSNLALHWHPQPHQVLQDWNLALRASGLVMFSCFGPDTLKEIRAAFQSQSQSEHFLPFVDMHDYGDMLIKAGFATPVMDMEKITLEYIDVKKLFQDVQSLGGNPMTTRQLSLMGKQRFQKIVEKLEDSRKPNASIPLTFEVIYGHAFKPVPSRLGKGESVIKLNFPNKNSIDGEN